MTTYYRNEYLFSEIYLQEITQQPEDTEILASLTTLKEYREFAHTATIREWKDSFVHEVLYTLRFGVKSENDRLTLLYPVGHTEAPLTLCYVLLPTEDLDNTTMGQNWAEKIISNLRHHNLKWGLLTNGEQWRIYHLDESTPYEIFLEMNLAAILQDNASQAYQIFHKFMKVENFTTDEQGQCHLDIFKLESLAKIDYIESELANALRQKEEGGKGVLSNLCMGYVEFLRANDAPNLDDDALRNKIYHGAMLYMFRLLFLLYADARGLLNETNAMLLKEVLSRSKTASANDTSNSSYNIWENLERIFVDIDQSYNGGLFDPHESEFTKFIEESRVNDVYLASAVYYLTSYQERSREEKAISYRDMSVRHLGTLYEGLLEHKLFITKEDTEVRTVKDKIQFIPASQGGRMVAGHYIPSGWVYFGSDRSERKATGSFYTPEFIVDSIVRNTVGEKLTQLRRDFLAKQEDLLSAVTKAVDQKERKALTELLEDNLKTFIKEKVLKLSVLDTAMGSGHFLVNTTNYIANFITEILNQFEMVGTTETSTTYWRRWVVENCIYGVDINPLAVELAKLSLWILSMSKEKPLSFLNHSLKTGNSLIGARLDDIGKYPGKENKKQHSIFSDDQDFKESVEKAISNYARITSTDSASLDVIADKKAWLDEIDDILKPYKLICDLHTSIYFGNEISEWKYKELIDKKDIVDSNNVVPSYFNWELEFPEIFIRRGGFDFEIGNPPWGADLSALEKEYLKVKYPEIDSSTPNSFAYFLGLSRRLSLYELSLIIPDSFLLKDYEKARALFGQYISLIHWYQNSAMPPNLKPFADVDHDVCIIQIPNEKTSHVKCMLSEYSSVEQTILTSSRTWDKKDIVVPQYSYVYNMLLTDNDIKIRNIVHNYPMLGNYMQCHEGIHSGNMRELLFKQEKERGDEKNLFMGAKHGDKIYNYYSEPSGWVVDYRKELIDKKSGRYASLRDENIFKKPKLYITRTGNPFYVFIDDQTYASNNFFSMQFKDYENNTIENLSFIASILNSRFAQYYIRKHIAPKIGSTFIETKIFHLEKIPVPEQIFKSKECRKELSEKTKNIIDLQRRLLREDEINIASHIKEEITQVQNEIDTLIYQYYNLTDYVKTIRENSL